MADTLESLATRMQRLARAFPDNATSVVVKSALVGLTTLVLRMPVDTGRARGNWFVEINASSEEFQDDRRESVGPGKSAAASAGPDDSVHLSNNTTYINRLNDGHSAQAPAGFIEDAVVISAGAVLIAAEQDLLKGF